MIFNNGLSDQNCEAIGFGRETAIFYAIFFSFKFIFRSRLLCGAVQLNLCGNLSENFFTDQSGGMKEMFQQMDEVEFRQYFRLSLSFSCHCSACLSAMKDWDTIEKRACAAFVHLFSKVADND